MSERLKVRLATPDDLPHILRMSHAFWQESGATHIPFDAASQAETALKLIESDDGLLLVAGTVGMFGAILYPAYFNRAYVICQELFWWLDPEYRHGRLGFELYDAGEAWAREHAHSLTMIALVALQPERVGKFYRAKGHEPLEIHFTKVF